MDPLFPPAAGRPFVLAPPSPPFSARPPVAAATTPRGECPLHPMAALVCTAKAKTFAQVMSGVAAATPVDGVEEPRERQV